MKTEPETKRGFVFQGLLIAVTAFLMISPFQVKSQTPIVGSLGGSVAVGSNGMATYSIPIEVVPGTCGVQPALSVVYSSAGGRGLLGSCWSLAGLSSVSRVPRSHFYDGDAGAVNFDASDRYALDGERLIRLSNGAYSAQGAMYGKEAEDFTRVTLNGTPDNGTQTQWFSAVAADGTVVEYGHNAGSKQTLGQNTLSWWMDRVTDPEGNYMTVEYTGSDGEIVPYRIRYTGNEAAGLYTYAKVILNYTSDPNPNRMWVGGQYTTVSRLLSSIDVYYISTLVRSYVFEYAYDRSTRLTAVVLKDASGTELTRTTVTWGTDGTTASVQTLNDLRGYCFVLGDFNGDNHTDLFLHAFNSETNRTNWSVRRGNGLGQFSSLSGPSGYIQGNVSPSAFFALDIEGDGIDDIGYIMNNVPDDSSSLKALHFRRPGTGYIDTTLAVSKTSEFHVGDFLGLGEIQAVTVGEPSGNLKTVTCTRNGASFAVHKDSRISVTDLNGNGKSDIQVVKDHDIDLYEYDASTGGFVKLIDSHYMTYTSSKDYFGDFNGDGNLDYIYYAPQGFFLRVSKGNDYAPSLSLPFNNLPINEGEPKYPLYISDLNGDGKDDIIQPDFNYNTQQLTLVTYLSRGLSGSEYRFDTIHFHDNAVFQWTPTMYHFSDMNGDGQTDLFYSGSIYDDPAIVSFPERRGHDLVSSFTDGFGKTVTLRYCYYNTPSTQCIGRDGRCVRWPLAKRVAEPDGIGGTSVIWHIYYNAVHDRERRQTLGFEQHETYLNGTNVREVFLYDGDCHRLVLKQCKAYYWVKDTCTLGTYVYEPDIGSLDRRYFFHHVISNTPSTQHLDYGRFVPYNTVSSEVNRLENTKRQTRTWLRTDGLAEKVSTAYGKASIQGEVDPEWVERDSSVYSYTAVTVTNGSQVMKLSGEVTRHRRNGYTQTPTVTTLYSYSSAGRLDSVSVADLDGKVGTTAYTYNTYGLPLTDTYTPAGMEPEVTSLEYAPNGRFVTRETDPLGHSRSMEHNLYTCQVTTETGIDGLTTSYRYDALGRVVCVTRPDGTIRYTAYEWNTDTEYPDAVWRIRVTESGAPETVEWRDILGRTVHSHTAGQGYHDVVYDALGRAVKSTFIPYATPSVTSPAKTWRHTSYDRYGRTVWERDPYTRLAYTYYDPEAVSSGDYFVTVTDSVRDTRRTQYHDGLGRLKRAVDAGGTVEYAYGYATRDGHIRDSLAVATGGTLTVALSDTRGNRVSIQDPDAGTVSSSYDAMNQLTSRTDANGNTASYTYDLLGRVHTETLTDGVSTETVVYDYSETPGTSLGKLHTVTHNGQTERIYTYDALGRVSAMDVIDGNTHYTHQYEYDNLGRLQYLTYPSGYRTRHLYNSYGELSSVVDAADRTLVFSVETRNVFRQPVVCRFGNGTGTEYGYNAYGLLTGINNGDVTDTSNTEVLPPDPGEETVYSIGTEYRQLVYAYNSRGFIESRSELNALQSETYLYDSLDRLVSHTVNGTGTTSRVYDGSGNTSSVTGVGSYTYGGTRPHAVTRVTGGTQCPIPAYQCDVEYGLRNRPVRIAGSGYAVTLDYDADGMRRHTRFLLNNTEYRLRTRVSPLHEVETSGGVTRQLDYIHAEGRVVAVHVRNGSADSLYYVLADHLGSWEKVLDGDKNTVQQTHFDPWGNRMSYTAWDTPQTQVSFPFSHGFTGHEHYDRFKIINANARLYDPVIGRFFSPDPFVQVPDFTQSFNRYSYCMNNPVMYSDPTGEVFVIDDIIAAAVLGAIFNSFTQIVAGNVNNVGDFFLAAGIGALSGAAGAFAGSAVAGAIKFGGFISGAASGAASGATSGFIAGSGNAWMQGKSFGQGLKAGGIAACMGLGSGALLGGLTQGYIDYKHGYNFWNGSKIDEFVTGTISTNWDDITNQYNSSQRAEYDTELLKDRISDSFGVNEGEYNINKITTHSSSGYKITQTGEYVNLETNSLIGGYCRSFSSGYSELHISPFTTSSDVITFKAVVGHELIHAYHHYIIPYNVFNKINSEKVAYRYTYNVYLSNGRLLKAIGVREMAMGLNYWGYAPIFYNYYPF